MSYPSSYSSENVFLSFKWEDSSATFISHLESSLKKVADHVCKDDDGLKRGDQISDSLLDAIDKSKIFIIVLSKNYGNSKWCMMELEKIVEISRTKRDIGVVPVFYEVDPSDVRNQTGYFGEQFNSLLSKKEVDENTKINWKRALHEVCGKEETIVIKNSRNESEDIKKIVELVNHMLLDMEDMIVAYHPVGLESRVQDVIQLLNSHKSEEPLLLGISGMLGIGKTTVAKAVYNQLRHDFKRKSFLFSNSNGLNLADYEFSLLQKLLFDICRTTEKIQTIESGIAILQERLHEERIFLVIDDVNDLDQLYTLFENRRLFGKGSKIIFTTRDECLLDRLNVDHVYRVKEMDVNESCELLSWYAFRQPIIREGFTSISMNFVKYCGGHPLALALIGSFLVDGNVVRWKFIQKNLNKTHGIPELMKCLRISFEELRDDDVKDIFLKIATLFIGMDKDDVIQTLKNAGHYPETGIDILEKRSLVTIDRNNRIGMHTLLRAMGREIKGERSRGLLEKKLFDVFLSFRGVDTRATFISHLYPSLQDAGIYAFKDDDGIQRGEKISASLLQVIGQSSICIVVLSTNYANSKWCMLELERIVEIGSTNGMPILPVFYKVDPSDVRNQTGEFGAQFDSLITEKKVDENTKRNWKTVLHEVGSIAGFNIKINSSDESEDIKKIVERVTHLLDKTELFVAEHPVGVESRVQNVIQLLKSKKSKDTIMLGILGMGGIGKTTLAKAVYNELRDDFDRKSFLFNVRNDWKLDNDKVSLQQRLLSDIYKTAKIEKINTVASGKAILPERLRHLRIFLVIDDVNELDQLNALCGNRSWFGKGSRIIITTRYANLLSRLDVDHVYRMEKMDARESLELFNWHAFKQPIPGEGFTSLSEDVVNYCEQLPLALEVIGSFLLTKSKEDWNDVLEKLKLFPDKEVLEVLKISFDGLPDEDMKDIFLDIAFFFIGMDQEDVAKILKDCGHFAVIGITTLVQQSLITIDRKNKIGMHDLLRDMGKEIVRMKSIEGNKEPSRLWRHEDVRELSKDNISLNVKGLTLKMSRLEPPICLKTKEFEKMNRLKLLQFAAGIQLDGHYEYLSKDLRWLCWHGFPLECMPKDLHQGSLVALDLQYSNNLDRVWRNDQLLVKLEILNLSHSHKLRHTPNFSKLPNLKKLILKDCPSLSSVCSSIAHLRKILLINLKDCPGLRELPKSIYTLDSVKTLILSGCTQIGKLEEDIEQMISLTTLVADNTAIEIVPLAVEKIKSLAYISLCGYKGHPSRFVQSFKDIEIQRLWLKCCSEAQLSQIVASILDSFNTGNCEEFSNIGTSSSTNSLTPLLIQLGMSCDVTNILRENILQTMPPIGSGLLPGDNYPNWLTFHSNSSSVTFKVPQVDGRSLKTIMCIVDSSSPNNTTTEGFKVMLVINYTKNTIQVYKRDGLLATSDEEWQRLISNIEPGNKIKVIVGFANEITVKKTTIYLVYDEPDENIFGRLFFAIPSFARTVLTSRPFWFCLAGVMVWSSLRRFEKGEETTLYLREEASTSSQGYNDSKSLDQNPSVDLQELKRKG